METVTAIALICRCISGLMEEVAADIKMTAKMLSKVSAREVPTIAMGMFSAEAMRIVLLKSDDAYKRSKADKLWEDESAKIRLAHYCGYSKQEAMAVCATLMAYISPDRYNKYLAPGDETSTAIKAAQYAQTAALIMEAIDNLSNGEVVAHPASMDLESMTTEGNA